MTNWQTKKLGDVMTIRHGRNQREVESANGDYPILGTGGEIGRANKFLYNSPSVLIGRKGTIDKPRYMDTPFWTVDTLFYSEIKPENVPKFLYYVFSTIDWKRYNEASGVPSLSASTISTIKVNAPEKPEQERIVGVLEVWDEYIEKLEQKIALKEQLKKGLMQQLLTGKRRLPGFNDEWQEFRLHELTKSSSLRNRDLFVDRVLSVTNKRGFVLPSDHFSKVVASDNLSNYKIVKKGEFAYNPSRINVGSIDLLTSYDAGVLSPMYVVFKTTKDLDSEFLKYWLQTARAKANIENAGSGSVRQSVDFKDFGSMKIVIPSVEEQRSIVSALNVIRLQIEQITKLKDLVKLQKKYLLRNLITGIIRTPEDLKPLDTSRPERSAL